MALAIDRCKYLDWLMSRLHQRNKLPKQVARNTQLDAGNAAFTPAQRNLLRATSCAQHATCCGQQASCCAQQVACYPQQIACYPHQVACCAQQVACCATSIKFARNLLRCCKRGIRYMLVRYGVDAVCDIELLIEIWRVEFPVNCSRSVNTWVRLNSHERQQRSISAYRVATS